ncbi:MAG: DNRLRE domain-containing protein [Pseudomonadota bacterium]
MRRTFNDGLLNSLTGNDAAGEGRDGGGPLIRARLSLRADVTSSAVAGTGPDDAEIGRETAASPLAVPTADVSWRFLADMSRIAELAYSDSPSFISSALDPHYYTYVPGSLYHFDVQIPLNDSTAVIADGVVFSAKSSNNQLVISFRGSNDIGDWIADAKFAFEIANNGYSTTLINYAGAFVDYVKYLVSAAPANMDIVFTGHSLGGMLAEQFTQFYYDPTDIYHLEAGNHKIIGVGVGSPGVMDVPWAPDGRFFHVARLQDDIGNYSRDDHIGRSIYFQDAQSNSIPGMTEHSITRYAEQLEQIAGSPLAGYLPASKPVWFLSRGVANNVMTSSTYGAVFGAGGGDQIRAASAGGLLAEGGEGDDVFFLGAYEDIVSGSGGDDTAIFAHDRAEYRLFRESGTGVYSVEDLATHAVDRLFGINLLKFGNAGAQRIETLNWSGTPAPTPTPAPSPSPTPTPTPPKPVPGDDFGNSAATAAAISANSAFAGKIETKGDTDWFKLTLTAGNSYGFAISGGSVGGMSGLSSPHLYLRDASGTIVADAAPASINASFQFAVKTSGTYYLEAASHANLGTGGYGLAVSPLGATPSTPPPPAAPEAVRLYLDEVEPSKAENDESMTFRVEYSGDLTGEVVINWQVQGSGSHAANAQDFVRTSGTVTLHEGRDYVYIRVTPQSDQVDEYDEGFTLSISVASGNASIRDGSAKGTILNDDGGRILPGVDELNNGFQTATPIVEDSWNRGFVTTPGDVDYFAVTLTAGATYDLVVLGDDDTSLIGGSESGFVKLLDPQAALYNSNFQLIAGAFTAPINSTRISYQFTPSVTATYYIAVREDGNNDVGQYFVKADVRIPADDYAASTATTGHLAVGEVQTANNERSGDDDWFAVDLVAGATYSFFAIDEFAVTGDPSGYIWPNWTDDLRVSLRDAQGHVVASGVGNPVIASEFLSQLAFTAAQSGTYFLSVSDASDSQKYRVGFDRLATSPSGTPTVLQPGPGDGVDVRFGHVRDHQDDSGLDDALLAVGGLWSTGSAGSALRFDIGTLPQDAAYAAIELYFAGATTDGGAASSPLPMVLGTPNANWDEHSTLGQMGGYYFESVVSAPIAPGWYRIDITDLYNGWQGGDRENNGITLLPMTMNGTTNNFYSSDYFNAALRPRLVVYDRQANEIRGGNSFDLIAGDDHANRIFGLDGDDLIAAAGGNDWIDGGAGADMIDGGDGYDSVSYRNSSAGVDVDLGANLNRGGWAEGDSLSNIESVEGSAFGDRLAGSQFVETLAGGAGNDALYGLAGDDRLDGGEGADRLEGGSGDDTYIVDDLRDQVVELDAEGTDTVESSVTYKMRANIENLTLTGTQAVNGAGNALANILIGNGAANKFHGGDGADWIDGRAGADRMEGSTGNDHYVVDNRDDKVIELANEGTDTVESSVSYALSQYVENLTLTGDAVQGQGNELDNAVTGSAGANKLDGGAGNDRIAGGAGRDRLTGGTGADGFYFSHMGVADSDKITDFSAAEDTLFLDVAVFAGIADGQLSSNAFRLGTAAQDADDRILYDQALGYIYYDADGNGAGAAVLVAAVTGGTVLTNADFWGFHG